MYQNQTPQAAADREAFGGTNRGNANTPHGRRNVNVTFYNRGGVGMTYTARTEDENGAYNGVFTVRAADLADAQARYNLKPSKARRGA